MLKPRLIPVLLLDSQKLVKTRNFTNEVYVGDPINTINIFTELGADEIILIDLEASRKQRPIDFKYLEKIASECFVPLSYGGGISNINEVNHLISNIGFEKIIFNSAIINAPKLVRESVDRFGNQAVIGSLDVKTFNSRREVMYNSGQKISTFTLKTWCQLVSKLSIGEILVNDITREGTRMGYEVDLFKEIKNLVDVPIIANGGAKSYSDMAEVVKQSGIHSAAASSIFLFQKNYSGVLINYPDISERNLLFSTLQDEENNFQLDNFYGKYEEVELSNSKYYDLKMCDKCLITEDIPNSKLDIKNECNYCDLHKELDNQFELGHKSDELLANYIKDLKKDGKGKNYDCIVGVSGGTDSSFLIHLLASHNVRILAVHFDNTWNSAISTSNIYKVLNRLNIDLETYVVDNAEYDDIYRSFMLAKVRDLEAPTDIGFMGVLYRVAQKHGIKHIAEGASFRTEGISPLEWLYMDGAYIRDVHRKYGRIKMRTFPNINLINFIKWTAFSNIKRTRPLYWIDYNKENAKRLLKDIYDWNWYGGHHMENKFTSFYHTYFLPKCFNIDFRQIEYSALVRSGQITKSRAQQELLKPKKINKELLSNVMNRLNFTEKQFYEIIESQKNNYKDFRTYKKIFEFLKPLFWLLLKMNRIPKSFYVKFCKK